MTYFVITVFCNIIKLSSWDFIKKIYAIFIMDLLTVTIAMY